ncbi:LysR family transcriptional regulator [Pseudomonas sp. MRSN 12121]|uniref:LysR family transcriptional regulator n=1 Tax=Pseudomonas sp. MRSN 12121 TaxID=1611770 RepID=UPI000AB7F92E|nr:LysR family transcriptional regulator [Pseudomonas sp. MRSN 12121]
MRVYKQVVDAGSFRGAAESLGMPAATVTVAIKELESALGVKLINRTTRNLNVTSDGAAYYEVCVRLLTDLDDAEASFRDRSKRPHGRVRVDVSPSIAYRLLIPNLKDFRVAYPDIDIVLGVGDRLVDLVQEGVDCVIRVGELESSTLAARRIGYFDFVICGSPDYFARYPEPSSLEELGEHELVYYFSTQTGRTKQWEEAGAEGRHQRPKTSLLVNDADAHLACGVHGLGLVRIPRFMATPYLETGALREVMKGSVSMRLPISILYPQNRHLTQKVRCFIDWVVEVFENSELVGKV